MEDEILDIVNESDEVIRKDKRINIVNQELRKGESVRVVNIFIFNFNGELLVPKRSLDRLIFPRCYDFSCGEHLESGEDYYTAAMRGLKEELNIENVKLQELGKLSPKDNVSSFMKVYKLIYDEPINDYDKKGIDKLYWFNLQEVEKMLKETPKKFKGDFKQIFERYLK